MWTRFVSILCLLVCASISAPAEGADKEKPPFPDIRIPGFARNERAIQALADKLPAVAAWYGKSPSELAALFRHDPTLWASPTGRLMYTCELERPLAAETGVTGSPSVIPATSFPLDQTFKLHSSTASSRVVYLDFNGQTVTGTAWNANFNGGATIVAAPFDLDGSPSTFNATELQMIQNIWKRVAEDYAPFAVDVTTEEPAVDALTRTSSSDTLFGNRIVITPTNFYPNAGGVSYIGAFDDVGEYYKTSWVFSNMLANGEKYIAEACSHENGHSVGLHHEGTTSGTVYYEGQGNWAPIMGNSYYKNVTQWSKGEYSGANNTEDQLQVMQNFGLAYYQDDHGNTTSAATVLSGATSISGSGFIERNTDVDVFTFVTGAGAISISVSPAPLGPDLNVLGELRDGSYNLIASSNTSNLGADLAATVPAGTYYLAISGTGSGDPSTTGYSKYATLGQYTISGTIVYAGSLQAPIAVASALTPTSGNAPLAVSFSSAGSSDVSPGVIVGYSWSFGDGSAPSSDPNPSHVYQVAGTYAATLTVTDNDGMTGSASITVSVKRDLYVSSIVLSPQASSTAASATATVYIKDSAGNLVAGAAVNGSWSGVVSGTSTGVTGTGGTVSLSSPQSSTSGTFTFTVTNVSAQGYTYNSTLNSQSSASATVSLAQDVFSAPSNLRASGAKSKVNLSWTDNSTTESGFYVERAISGSASFTRVAAVGANSTSYADTSATKGTPYIYRVQGYNAGGVTAYSNAATAKAR